MTALEDKVRQALQAKAGQVPFDVPPPLRLPARRRRFFLWPTAAARAGERRPGAAGWRRWLRRCW